MERQTVMILGAKSDIAKALGREYAKAGYNLLLVARNPESLNDFAADVRIRHEVSVSSAACDVLDPQACEALYAKLPTSPFGVISAVGYLGDQAIAESEGDEARRIMDTNFNGPSYFLNIVAHDFEKKARGFIIGISSVAGERGRKSNYFYGAAKAGFTAYLSGLRNRLHDSNVQVLTVKPGFVRTQMTEQLDLPERLTASPERAAKDIFRAQQKGRNVCYTLWIWKWIMLAIGLIPENLFKKMNIGS